MSHRVRVWDLPTRLFHWSLAICVVGLVTTAKAGAMEWHFRLGYTTLALLLFRLVWGFCGGRWSRFSSFLHSPRDTLAYLRGQGAPDLSVGHSPTGAVSVFALLGVLALQALTGLSSDDEISFTGPLARFVSNDTVSLATWYHKDIGQWLVIGLACLHLLAVLFYLWGKKQNLIAPMVHGDKQLTHSTEPARDTASTRWMALVVLAASAAVVRWIAGLSA